MPLISCTQIFIKTTNIPITNHKPAIPDSHKWHAHLFRLGYDKCLLFTHAQSLYSVVINNVKAKDFKNLPDLFLSKLTEVMTNDKMPPHLIDQFITDCDFTWVKNDASARRVLGSQNDMVRMIEIEVMQNPLASDVELSDVANDCPFSVIDMERPKIQIKSNFCYTE